MMAKWVEQHLQDQSASHLCGFEPAWKHMQDGLTVPAVYQWFSPVIPVSSTISKLSDTIRAIQNVVISEISKFNT